MPEQIIRAPDAGDALHIAETLGMRLCHDLSGLVGTLTGMVEMLAEEAAGPPNDLLLMADEAARGLSARLRLLRAAWAGECGSLDRDAITALLPGLHLPHRAGVDVSGLAGPYPEAFARVLLNALLLAAEAVSRGGAVTLADGPGGDVTVRIEGPRAAWPDGLMATLADGAALLAAEPRSLQAPLLAALARRAGVRLALGTAGPDAPPLMLLRRAA